MKAISTAAFAFAVFAMPIPGNALTCSDHVSAVHQLKCVELQHKLREIQILESPHGNLWRDYESTSNDSAGKISMIWLEADWPIKCRPTAITKPISFYIRCVDKETSLFFGSDCKIGQGFDGPIDVFLSIDQKVISLQMEGSMDEEAVGLWSTEETLNVVEKMIGAEKLFARINRPLNTPINAFFTIKGIEDSVAVVGKACGW